MVAVAVVVVVVVIGLWLLPARRVVHVDGGWFFCFFIPPKSEGLRPLPAS